MTDQAELTKPAETAKALQISIATLYRWRKMPRFPQPLKIGRIVFYDVQAIKEWIAVEGETDQAISERAFKALERSSKQ